MKKKLYAIIITVVMLANLICPAMAQTITANSFTGTINLDSSVASKVDLSDIDIKVYSLTVAYTDPTSGQNDYYDNYVFTVNPAKGGVFTFSKPSAEFKIEIDLGTLPSGIGVDKFECTYENGQINDTFTLYSVHNAEMVMENAYSTPTVICYAQNGNRIFADYDIRLSAESASVSRSASIDILKTQSATFSGAVSSGKSFSFSKTFDLSEMSSLDKVNFYANTNMITEEEKIERYCDVIIARDFSQGACLNPVINEISNYVDQNASELSSSIENKATQILSVPSTSQFDDCYENDYFRIHYEDELSLTLVRAIASAFSAYRNNLIALGFGTPIVDAQYNAGTGNGKYNVYVTAASSANGSGIAGATFQAENVSAQKYSTYIYLYNIFENTENPSYHLRIISETIAHEYFHAVQATYNYYRGSETLWFGEACACWYSVYMGYADNVTNQINNFFGMGRHKQHIKISENYNDTYAKVLFPLTLDISYGGYSTIKSIWQQLSTMGSYNFSTLKNAVDNGLENNYQSATFNDVFKTYALYNTDPSYYYSSRIPMDDEEEQTYYQWINNGFAGAYYGESLNPYSAVYIKIVPSIDTNIYNCTFTVTGAITISGSFNSSTIAVAKVSKTSQGNCVANYVSVVGTAFPINESSLGGNSATELYYVVINTGISEDENTITTTISQRENQ